MLSPWENAGPLWRVGGAGLACAARLLLHEGFAKEERVAGLLSDLRDEGLSGRCQRGAWHLCRTVCRP